MSEDNQSGPVPAAPGTPATPVQIVDAKEAAAANKMVKVKVLKHVGGHMPGDSVELTQAEADALCKVREVYHGEHLVQVRYAIPADQEGELSKADISTLTAAEAKALGLVNRVDSSAMFANDPVMKKATEGKEPVKIRHESPIAPIPNEGEMPTAEEPTGLTTDKNGSQYDPVLEKKQREEKKKAAAKK